MAKKLLIRTLETTDGTTPVVEDEQMVYKETIAELSARKHFESLNNSLPELLRHKLEEVEVDDFGKVIKAKPAAKKKPDAE